MQPCVFVWQESNSVALSCDCLAHLYRNSADHGERVRRHPSDMTDEEWTAVREQLPAPAEFVVGAAVGPVLAVLRDQHAVGCASTTTIEDSSSTGRGRDPGRMWKPLQLGERKSLPASPGRVLLGAYNGGVHCNDSGEAVLGVGLGERGR